MGGGGYTVVLSSYLLFCAQKSLLMVSMKPHEVPGTKAASSTCKASVLPSEIPNGLLFYFLMVRFKGCCYLPLGENKVFSILQFKTFIMAWRFATMLFFHVQRATVPHSPPKDQYHSTSAPRCLCSTLTWQSQLSC